MNWKGALTIGLAVFLFCGCAKDRVAGRHLSEAERMKYAQQHHLMHLPPSDVPLEMNDRVIAWLDYFTGAGRGHFERYLERSGRYTKLMQDILRQNGLPQDLIYVALIESGFNNNAYSRAAAVGPWQFIRGTGSRYDLEINRYVDERRHPVKSTWAAARYLKDLYNEFGDWYLAMAAYNAGEGRIRDAVADAGTKRFWDIADADNHYLRAETRDYVPKFIAAAIIAKMPQNFGFGSVSYQRPLEYDTTTVETQTDLDVIADCAGVGTGDIMDLNPHLVRGTTPPGYNNYTVHVPKGTVPAFKAKYAALPESERIKVVYHTVRRGENAALIAKRYGISKSALLAANDISRRHKLRAGTTLVIPRGGALASYDDGGDDSREYVRSKKVVYHRVKKGDTLARIANRYGVSVAQVKSWNSISKRHPLRAGSTIKIYKTVTVAKAAPKKDRRTEIAMEEESVTQEGREYKIRAGETLWDISKRYGLSVDELAKRNNMEPTAVIKAGQKIVITKPQEKAAKKNVQTASDVPEKKVEVARTQTPAVDDTSENELQTKAEDPQSKMIAMAYSKESSPDDIDLALEEDTKSAGKETGSKEVKVKTTKKYTIKKGDSLATIAKRHGVKVQDLMKWNNIKNSKAVRIGQVLKIQSTVTQIKKTKNDAVKPQLPKPNTTTVDVPIVDAPKKEAAAPESLSYKVKNGDTLWDIARRHGVTIADLQSWNNLSDPSAVKPGDSITIHQRQF